MNRIAAGGLAVALASFGLAAAEPKPDRSRSTKADEKTTDKQPTPLRPPVIIAPLSADVLAEAVKDEQNACTRRLDVCAKLRELAAAKNDEALLTRIDELEKQAVEICQARVARMGIRGSATRSSREPVAEKTPAVDTKAPAAPVPVSGGI